MYHRKAKLALGQVLTVALVIRIVLRRQVAVVVPDLERQPQDGRQFGKVFLVVAEQLHQPDGQHEQAARLPDHHLLVLRLGRTDEIIPPVDLHALAAVQLQQLLRHHLLGLLNRV